MIVDITAGKGLTQLETGLTPDIAFDIAPQNKNTVKADWGNLPLQDESVDISIFDPPYGTSSFTSSWGLSRVQDWKRRNGLFLDRSDFERSILRAFREINRILKQDGICLFKWGTRQYSLSGILRFASSLLVVDGILIDRPSAGAHKKALIEGTANRTYWVVLSKPQMA